MCSQTHLSSLLPYASPPASPFTVLQRGHLASASQVPLVKKHCLSQEHSPLVPVLRWKVLSSRQQFLKFCETLYCLHPGTTLSVSPK